MIHHSISRERLINLNSDYLEHEVNASLVYIRASLQAISAGKKDWSTQLMTGVEKHLNDMAQYLKMRKQNEMNAYLRPSNKVEVQVEG